MNATTKTIIDEIRAHRDSIDFNVLNCASDEEMDEYLEQAIADRATLLSILAEIGALPDEWLGLHPTNAISQTQYDAAITAIRICVDQLKTILKRVQT